MALASCERLPALPEHGERALNPLNPDGAVGLFIARLAAACSHRDDIHVRLTRTQSPNAAVIDAITVFSGADKRSVELSPGEVDQVTLRPDGERPDIILTFRVDGTARSWQGPPLAKVAAAAAAAVSEPSPRTDAEARSFYAGQARLLREQMD